jgi:hypothetical protein
MSDLIRQLMKERQDAMLATGEGPVDMDNYDESIQEQMAAPEGAEELLALYEQILGPSMARQILDQYLSGGGQTMQMGMEQPMPEQPMSPMISSVAQLDR